MDQFKFRLIVLLLFFGNPEAAAAEVNFEIQTLESRMASLENEVTMLKTEKNEFLTIKSDVSFLLEKNSEIMEILTKIGQNHQSSQSNEVGVVKTDDNLSYLQTISGMHFHRSQFSGHTRVFHIKQRSLHNRKIILMKISKDLASSIDNLVQVVPLDGGNEAKMAIKMFPYR